MSGTVKRPGLVSEYNVDGQRRYRHHLEAQLAALEAFDQTAAFGLRLRLNPVSYRDVVTGDTLQKIEHDIWRAMQPHSPPDHYYGRPASFSNKVGFWPLAWQEFKTSIKSDKEASDYGNCEIEGFAVPEEVLDQPAP